MENGRATLNSRCHYSKSVQIIANRCCMKWLQFSGNLGILPLQQIVKLHLMLEVASLNQMRGNCLTIVPPCNNLVHCSWKRFKRRVNWATKVWELGIRGILFAMRLAQKKLPHRQTGS